MPVDNIAAVALIATPYEVHKRIVEPFEWNGILFTPVYDPHGFIKKYTGEHKNMFFSFSDGQLSIRNSLHKFYKGNNYEDFSYLELKDTVLQLSELIKIKPAGIILNKLEVGLNLLLQIPANDILPLFLFYKWKEFDKNRIGSKLWGVECRLYEYVVKAYDKATQIKKIEKININANIFRFEIAYQRSRKIPVDTLEDLTKKEKVDELLQECINIFSAIVFFEEINFLNVSNRERELYFAGCEKSFWDVEKQLNDETAKSKREKFSEIIKQNRIKDNKGLLLSLIQDKIEVLMS